MRTLRLVVLALSAAAAWPFPALAAWLDWSGANLPVCRTNADQLRPVCVSDGASGSIVVWQDYRSGESDIFAQHILASGAVDPAWPPEGAAVCLQLGVQNGLTVAPDGAGGVVVAWHDSRTGDWDVYAQRLDSTGAPQWPVNGLALCTVSTQQAYAGLAPDGSGGWIVCWQDQRNGNDDIYAQRVSAGGALLWTTNGVAVSTVANGQLTPKLVSDGTGGAIVSWLDSRNGNPDVYAQRVSGTGTAQWTINGVPLCTAAGSQSEHTVIVDGDGGAIVVWEDLRSGSTDIYAQRVSAVGMPLWPANGVALCTATGEQAMSTALADGAGGALVVWADYRSLYADIYAQRISGAGVTQWASQGVALCAAINHQNLPSAASDGAGGAIVAWQDYRGGSGDIYTQRINAAGATQWTPDGVALCTHVSAQSTPTLESDGSNGAMVAWEDYRSGQGADIYVQHVSSGGSLGTNVAPVIVGAPDTPNDQGGTLKLMWTASLLDAEPFRAIADYRVWRSVPPQLVEESALASGAHLVAPNDGFALERGRSFRATTTAAGTIYWEYLSTHIARRFAGYSTVVSTLSDSVAGSNPYTLFMVEARCTDGITYWDSAPDSGYSVDNLSPPIPMPFVANYVGSDVAFHWVPSTAADFREFRLHRGNSMDFFPAPANLIYSGPDTGFVDQSGIGGFYKLAAVDVHGNIGRFALVSPTLPTSTLASLVSAEWTGTAASLVWYGAGLSGLGATLYRSDDGAEWTLIAQLAADGAGYVRYSDASVLPRHRYSYRLGILDEGVERFAGETSLEIPGGRLAIRAVASNPVRGDALSFVVAFANAQPVRARVLDLAGRVVREQVVQPDLSGRLTISLGAGARLRAGVYLLDLLQSGERAVTRFTYLR